MSHNVFHKGTGKTPVDFSGSPFFRSFSTEFSRGFCTGFLVEKAPHPVFFLVFNNTTNTTIGYY